MFSLCLKTTSHFQGGAIMKYRLFFPFLVLALTGLATQCLAIEKNITRIEDPVIFLGKELNDLIGSKPESLALMAYHDGRFKPIPFQIDQKHKDGTYAFTNGKDASTDSDPSFDVNDELVFMINDLGSKAPPKILPKGANIGQELVVTDPLDNAKGWAYLFAFYTNPPKTDFKYIHTTYSEEDGSFKVKAKNAKKKESVYFKHPKGKLLVDEARFFSDGKFSEDFLDRVKIRTKWKFRFLPTINVPIDEWLKGDVNGWITGPVRAIVNSEIYIKFTFIKFSTGGYILETYYRNCLRSEFALAKGITPDSVVTAEPIMGYLDMNKHILNHKVYSKSLLPSSPILFDDNISPEEEKIDKDDDHRWIVGYGPLGALVNRLYVANIRAGIYLNEDLDTPKKPEEQNGEIGCGWKIAKPDENDDSTITPDDLKKAGLAPNATHIHIYLLESGFKPPMEQPILNIQDNPVKVTSSKYLNSVALNQ